MAGCGGQHEAVPHRPATPRQTAPPSGPIARNRGGRSAPWGSSSARSRGGGDDRRGHQARDRRLDLETAVLAATVPVTGAAASGCAAQARGRCPEPASNPEVASNPIQPAPGRYTSAHACKSARSASISGTGASSRRAGSGSRTRSGRRSPGCARPGPAARRRPGTSRSRAPGSALGSARPAPRV